MKINVKWLKDILPKLPSNHKLCDKLTSTGLEVSDIKRIKSDFILDIDVTPNRPDCLSVYGIARDLSASYKVKPLELKIVKIPLKKSAGIIKSVNKKISPHYTCLQINNIDNKIKTPTFMKNRLISCEITPVNFVVDLLNYVMIELGQPFHAFDKDRLVGKLSIRLSKKNEIINALNDKKYNLEKDTPVIADESKVHAIAGIIGSKDSSITTSTKNIVIECAHFLPEIIRSTSKIYRIQTDSSYRFERGVDPIPHQKVLGRVLYFIKKFSKFKSLSSSNFFDKKLKESKKNKVAVSKNQIKRILGKKIDIITIKNIFKYLELETKVTKDLISVNVPTFRFDIDNDHDLMEEIARIIGYDKFTPEALPPTNNNKMLKRKINFSDRLLSSLVFKGYNEVKSYSFLPKNYQKHFVPKSTIVHIRNPISDDKAEMRTSLIPGLVKTYKYNANRQHNNLKIFELGNVYQGKNKSLISEYKNVAGVISGKKSNLSLKIDSQDLTFFDLKGDLVSILPDLEFKLSSKCKFLNDNIQASVFQNNKQIGFCGEISDLLYTTESIKERIFAFEISLKSSIFPISISYKKISPFPKVQRDLTLLVDDKISGKDIIDIITEQSYKYLINIKINDVFHSDDFGNSKKSISLEFQFQNKNSTLVDNDVNDAIDKIISLLNKYFDARLRI